MLKFDQLFMGILKEIDVFNFALARCNLHLQGVYTFIFILYCGFQNARETEMSIMLLALARVCCYTSYEI